MSKPDKPIFNQQGGRGKLYGPTHGATYMGTYQTVSYTHLTLPTKA